MMHLSQLLLHLLSLLLILSLLFSQSTAIRSSTLKYVSTQSLQSQENAYDNFSPLKVSCALNGMNIPALIDTGAQVSIMSLSCAKRCGISHLIDRQYAGRAIGVGSSEILGRISNIRVHIGDIIGFKTNIAVLKDSSIDYIIGMDVLRKFKCNICIGDSYMRMKVKEKYIRIPLIHDRSKVSHSHSHEDVELLKEEEEGGSQSPSNSEDSTHIEEASNVSNEEAKEKEKEPISVYSMKRRRIFPSRLTKISSPSSLSMEEEEEEGEDEESSYSNISMEGV